MYIILLIAHIVSLAIGMGIGFAMKPLSALAVFFRSAVSLSDGCEGSHKPKIPLC